MLPQPEYLVLFYPHNVAAGQLKIKGASINSNDFIVVLNVVEYTCATQSVSEYICVGCSYVRVYSILALTCYT